ncbi:hypothetical protein GQ53DRAFT_56737 [Thozetella sp. PMI_491]|nr:hypothetical protein GQ53DRAFT_56737 [Thozetella sp. PMI_491]
MIVWAICAATCARHASGCSASDIHLCDRRRYFFLCYKRLKMLLFCVALPRVARFGSCGEAEDLVTVVLRCPRSQMRPRAITVGYRLQIRSPHRQQTGSQVVL